MGGKNLRAGFIRNPGRIPDDVESALIKIKAAAERPASGQKIFQKEFDQAEGSML